MYDRNGATVLESDASVVSELRAMGVTLDVAPTKLTAGSGDAVCLVLDALTEYVLRATRFVFRAPAHGSEAGMEEDVDDAGADAGDAEGTAVDIADDEVLSLLWSPSPITRLWCCTFVVGLLCCCACLPLRSLTPGAGLRVVQRSDSPERCDGRDGASAHSD